MLIYKKLKDPNLERNFKSTLNTIFNEYVPIYTRNTIYNYINNLSYAYALSQPDIKTNYEKVVKKV